jgi:hypothetical protein
MARKPKELMTEPIIDLTSMNPSQPPRAPFIKNIWPRLIELWLAAVLIAFFVVRVLGSSTAQRILNTLGHRHFA